MVGNIVKAIRNMNGDTQKEMAEKLSFSHVTLSHIENGTRILDLNSYKRLVEVYELDDYMKEKLQEAYNQQFEVKKIIYPEIERLKNENWAYAEEKNRLLKENKALKEQNNMLIAENRMFSSKIREIKELLKKFE